MVLEFPAPASPILGASPEIRLKSAVPGRERWFARPLVSAPRLAAQIEAVLARQAGVRSVSANPRTGGILVQFDGVLSREAVLRSIEEAIRATGIAPRRAPRAAAADPLEPLPKTGFGLASPSFWLIAGGIVVVPRLLVGAAAVTNPVLLSATLLGLGGVAAAGMWRTFHAAPRADAGTAEGAAAAPPQIERFLKYVRPHRGEFLKAAAFSMINKVLDFGPPIVTGMALDIVANEKVFLFSKLGVASLSTQLWLLGGFAVAVYVLECVTEYAYKVRWRDLAQKVQHDLRRDAFQHIQRLQLSYLEDEHTGNLAQLVNDNINQIQRFLDDGVHGFLEVGTNFVAIVVLFAWLSPNVAWIALWPFPVVAWMMYRYYRRIRPLYREVSARSGAVASQLVDSFGGIVTIRSFTNEEREVERLEKLSEEYMEANRPVIRLFAEFSTMVRLPVLAAFTGVLVLGGFSVIGGGLTTGKFAATLFLIPRFLFPFAYLGDTIDSYQRTLSSVGRVFDVMDLPVEPEGGERRLLPGDLRGDVSFEGIDFGYGPSTPVLSGFDLSVEAGQSVALVGPTGAGKTTVAKLLLRFYSPGEGRILLDGIDIRELRLKDLRRAIGLVSQDVFLFDGTIRENITYGSPGATFEEITRAAGMAEAREFIESLPDDYDTAIGERGLKLSGGQRQRICLARAILKDPRILVLDEATSSLDNETEAAIQRSLARLAVGRTTIVIAHRLSTIRHSDRIFVLGTNGHIVEMGSHDELLEQNGFYASLWRVQTGEGPHGEDAQPGDGLLVLGAYAPPENP
ncbi:MAG TPA: ABC transporter transmembrane domain-containing protein [Thermoanaerobaculia bacterium]|nr:ABC transporter transmembrane domain-containing protein [Thermoanaerobaculia bacterium]